MKRFSEMSRDELKQLVKRLEKEKEELKVAGMDSQAAVAEQKYRMARSYLLDPAAIRIDALYEVEGENQLFRVEYVNGVMAWGTLGDSTEKVSYPIAMLRDYCEKA